MYYNVSRGSSRSAIPEKEAHEASTLEDIKVSLFQYLVAVEPQNMVYATKSNVNDEQFAPCIQL